MGSDQDGLMTVQMQIKLRDKVKWHISENEAELRSMALSQNDDVVKDGKRTLQGPNKYHALLVRFSLVAPFRTRLVTS